MAAVTLDHGVQPDDEPICVKFTEGEAQLLSLKTSLAQELAEGEAVLPA